MCPGGKICWLSGNYCRCLAALGSAIAGGFAVRFSPATLVINGIKFPRVPANPGGANCSYSSTTDPTPATLPVRAVNSEAARYSVRASFLIPAWYGLSLSCQHTILACHQ